MGIFNRFKIQTYNVGIITKRIADVLVDGIQPGDIKWLKHKYKDRFFADPFLFKQDENYYYILCEEFLFFEEKGKITCLKVSKNTFELESKKVIIEENYHLSFPYCKEGSNFVIPEACKSNKSFKYEIDENFNVTSKVKILDEGIIDTIFLEEGDTTWMYTAKTKIPSTELYIYKGSKWQNFIPFPNTPVLSDNRTSRSAGDFFYVKDKLYRAVQDCKGRYGRQTKIMEIKKIGEHGYDAIEICTLNSFSNPPFDETMHTFNVYKDCIIVDGSKDYLRFPMKFFYKKCRKLFMNREKKNEKKRSY